MVTLDNYFNRAPELRLAAAARELFDDDEWTYLYHKRNNHPRPLILQSMWNAQSHCMLEHADWLEGVMLAVKNPEHYCSKTFLEDPDELAEFLYQEYRDRKKYERDRRESIAMAKRYAKLEAKMLRQEQEHQKKMEKARAERRRLKAQQRMKIPAHIREQLKKK